MSNMGIRKFGGKAYHLYTGEGLSWGKTTAGKTTAKRIASKLRQQGYKVRLVRYGDGFSIYLRK